MGFRAAAGSLLLLLPILSAAELRRIVPPDPAVTLCTQGDSFFRNAEFERAGQCYRDAVARDPGSARAHLGLGRIARLQFQRKTAYDQLGAAFRLDPRDPDILFAYSEYVSVPQVRDGLYEALKASIDPQDPRLQHVVAKLQIDGAGRTRGLNRLASPYRNYRFKLWPFLPANSTSYGAVLKASINGGKPLRLLVDTGAKGIILSRKSVRDLGLERIVDSEISGLGYGTSNSSHVTIGRSLEIGDLKLANCLFEVTDKSVVSGADGVIGTEVFQGFLLRLDFWSQVLELSPFPEPVASLLDPWLDRDAPRQAGRETSMPTYHVGHLLAVNAAVDRRASGLFILDTGSAYNTVSSELLGSHRGLAAGRSFQVAQGAMSMQMAVSPVEFRLQGGPWLTEANVAGVDLTGMSQQAGARIAGMLGYSALSKWTLTLNYRDGDVQIEPRGRR